jgi:hypothetical protein
MGVRSHPTRIYVPVVPLPIYVSISLVGTGCVPGETEEEAPWKLLLLGIFMQKNLT